MRRIVFHLQTTLDNRLAGADGGFWEPFPWGEPETAHLNKVIGRVDTWAMSRKIYEVIVPWWDRVAAGEMPPDAGAITAADREFAARQQAMAKVVFSRSSAPADNRVLVRGELAGELARLKGQAGGDILLSCGPATLAPLAARPGLIDEYLLAVSPIVLAAGPRVFDGLTADLPLRLTEATVFDAGSLLLRYQPLP